MVNIIVCLSESKPKEVSKMANILFIQYRQNVLVSSCTRTNMFKWSQKLKCFVSFVMYFAEGFIECRK